LHALHTGSRPHNNNKTHAIHGQSVTLHPRIKQQQQQNARCKKTLSLSSLCPLSLSLSLHISLTQFCFQASSRSGRLGGRGRADRQTGRERCGQRVCHLRGFRDPEDVARHCGELRRGAVWRGAGRATCVARSVRERARAREREQEPIYPQRASKRPAPLLGDAMPRPPAARVEVGVLDGMCVMSDGHPRPDPPSTLSPPPSSPPPPRPD
jgi:hypothetical protein